MISSKILSDLFGALEEHVTTVDTSGTDTPNLFSDFKVVRSEQNGSEPAYPYCSYKLLTQRGKGIVSSELNNPNPVEITFKHSEEFSGNISINFCSNSITPLDKIAKKARRWFQRFGQQVFRDLGIAVYVESTVTDRTTYIDSVEVYEVRLGFDIRVRVLDSFLEKVPAVDLDGTLAGVEFL